MYSFNIYLVFVVLSLCMTAALYGSYRLGLRRHKGEASEAFASHITMLHNSILGTLALILGFTFSVALQRHDAHREALVEEANSIRAVYLNAQLVAEPATKALRDQLRGYSALRIQEAVIPIANEYERQPLLNKARAMQAGLWGQAVNAATLNGDTDAKAQLTDSLVELMSIFRKRNAALNYHVPEEVLLVLYLTFIASAASLGYATGIARHRLSRVSYLLFLLVALVNLVILDLDHPRSGVINVNQSELMALQADLSAVGH